MAVRAAIHVKNNENLLSGELLLGEEESLLGGMTARPGSNIMGKRNNGRFLGSEIVDIVRFEASQAPRW